MRYFRILKVDSRWLESEIRKGTIFYDTHNGFNGLSGRQFCSTAARRENGYSYDDMPVEEVLRWVKLYRCVFWRN